MGRARGRESAPAQRQTRGLAPCSPFAQTSGPTEVAGREIDVAGAQTTPIMCRTTRPSRIDQMASRAHQTPPASTFPGRVYSPERLHRPGRTWIAKNMPEPAPVKLPPRHRRRSPHARSRTSGHREQNPTPPRVKTPHKPSPVVDQVLAAARNLALGLFRPNGVTNTGETTEWIVRTEAEPSANHYVA